METDVLVVGAGPGGSSFARIASQMGLDVLMVDKRKDIGSPVRCGEALGVGEIVKEGLDLPKHAYSTEVYGAKLVAPNGKEIVWKKDEPEGWILERKMFDRWLAELAIDKGAKLKMYTRAVDAKKDEDGWEVKLIHGTEEEFVRAKLVVSAEGMEALFARKLGFKTFIKISEVDTCYEYEVHPYEHENLIELYFGNEVAPRGYVWVFPKANKKANVGIGIGGAIVNGNKHGIPGAMPKPLLDSFMQEHMANVSTLEDFGGVISVGLPINEFVKDNALIIGTAARQVDAIHGGGIAMAMEAGVMAGKVVAEAFSKKDLSKKALSKYEQEWRNSTGKTVEQRYKLRKVLERLSDDDLNHIFNSISQDDIFNIMEGKFAGTVAKILAGRPGLLMKLRELV